MWPLAIFCTSWKSVFNQGEHQEIVPTITTTITTTGPQNFLIEMQLVLIFFFNIWSPDLIIALKEVLQPELKLGIFPAHGEFWSGFCRQLIHLRFLPWKWNLFELNFLQWLRRPDYLDTAVEFDTETVEMQATATQSRRKQDKKNKKLTMLFGSQYERVLF